MSIRTAAQEDRSQHGAEVTFFSLAPHALVAPYFSKRHQLPDNAYSHRWPQ